MPKTAVMEKPAEQRAQTAKRGRYYSPRVDILELPEEIRLFLEMPGVQAKDLHVNVENGVLTVLGEAAARQADGQRFLLREYGVGDFQRSFRLDERVDAENIEAVLKNGVLQLVLPKPAAARPRKIEVQVKE